MDEKDYVRFLVSMREFNTLKQIDSLYRLRSQASSQVPKALYSALGTTHADALVQIICYALLPNHYHFLLKQAAKGGISKFMQKLSSGYTRYFNTKYKRTGSLFAGTYKSVPVKTDGYLWRLSCYINGNPEIHKIAEAENYKWSSYPDYIGKRKGTLCNKNIILKDFENIQEYKDFVDVIIKDSRQRKDDINPVRNEALSNGVKRYMLE